MIPQKHDGPQAHVASGPPFKNVLCEFLRDCRLRPACVGAVSRPRLVRVFASHLARWILRLQTALLLRENSHHQLMLKPF